MSAGCNNHFYLDTLTFYILKLMPMPTSQISHETSSERGAGPGFSNYRARLNGGGRSED